MNYSIPKLEDNQQLWVTDEHGNRLMALGEIFERLRQGGMGLGRYVTNDKNELAKMFTATLSFGASNGCQIDPEKASVIIEQLAAFVVSKSLPMPASVINEKGYSLQEKIESACNRM